MSKKAGYFFQVDYIRCFASLAVATFHLGGKVLPVLKYGWLGVSLFFVLSGFIICWALPSDYSWRWSGTFLLKRITRIEPPYIASILLVLSINLLVNPAYPFAWDNIALHLAYLNNFFDQPYLSPVYWTLAIEFHFYLLLALIFPVIIMPAGKWWVVMLCLLSAVFHIPGVLLSNYFPLFGMGVTCFLYRKGHLNRLMLFLMISAVSACSLYGLGWMETLTGLMACAALLAPLPRNRLIGFFSKISFSLYLVHDFAGGLFIHYWHSILPHTMLYNGAVFLSGIAFSVLCAWVFYQVIESPCYRQSKSILFPVKT